MNRRSLLSLLGVAPVVALAKPAPAPVEDVVTLYPGASYSIDTGLAERCVVVEEQAQRLAAFVKRKEIVGYLPFNPPVPIVEYRYELEPEAKGTLEASHG